MSTLVRNERESFVINGSKTGTVARHVTGRTNRPSRSRSTAIVAYTLIITALILGRSETSCAVSTAVKAVHRREPVPSGQLIKTETSVNNSSRKIRNILYYI